jgi:hypothetical protein
MNSNGIGRRDTVDASPDYRVDQRIDIAAVPFWRAKRAQERIVKLVDTFPFGTVELNMTHRLCIVSTDKMKTACSSWRRDRYGVKALVMIVGVVHRTGAVVDDESSGTSRRASRWNVKDGISIRQHPRAKGTRGYLVRRRHEITGDMAIEVYTQIPRHLLFAL